MISVDLTLSILIIVCSSSKETVLVGLRGEIVRSRIVGRSGPTATKATFRDPTKQKSEKRNKSSSQNTQHTATKMAFHQETREFKFPLVPSSDTKGFLPLFDTFKSKPFGTIATVKGSYDGWQTPINVMQTLCEEEKEGLVDLDYLQRLYNKYGRSDCVPRVRRTEYSLGYESSRAKGVCNELGAIIVKGPFRGNTEDSTQHPQAESQLR